MEYGEIGETMCIRKGKQRSIKRVNKIKGDPDNDEWISRGFTAYKAKNQVRTNCLVQTL